MAVANNIALGKNVTMSSLYTSNTLGDGDWEYAVDGNTSKDWYVGGCASTNSESNPWLLLDLGGTFTVTSLKIFNREDNGFCEYVISILARSTIPHFDLSHLTL